MKNYEYPTWLVPLDIAKELKAIGFDEPCTFAIDYTQYIEPFLVQHLNKGYNAVFYGEVRMLKYETLDKDLLDKIAIIPTWTDVFAWFRARGLYSYIRPYIAPENFYIYSIYDNNNFDKCCGRRDTYEEAQKECVKALIRTYKQEQPINESE